MKQSLNWTNIRGLNASFVFIWPQLSCTYNFIIYFNINQFATYFRLYSIIILNMTVSNGLVFIHQFFNHTSYIFLSYCQSRTTIWNSALRSMWYIHITFRNANKMFKIVCLIWKSYQNLDYNTILKWYLSKKLWYCNIYDCFYAILPLFTFISRTALLDLCLINSVKT